MLPGCTQMAFWALNGTTLPFNYNQPWNIRERIRARRIPLIQIHIDRRYSVNRSCMQFCRNEEMKLREIGSSAHTSDENGVNFAVSLSTSCVFKVQSRFKASSCGHRAYRWQSISGLIENMPCSGASKTLSL